jgi:hypothetical protein
VVRLDIVHRKLAELDDRVARVPTYRQREQPQIEQR